MDLIYCHRLQTGNAEFLKEVRVQMIAVLQRVSHAQVEVGGQLIGKAEKGYLILLGVEHADTLEDIIWLSNKIIGLRVFGDDHGKMNLSINDISGDILLVSQFTLHASTKKGNRPSFIEAAKPDQAKELYAKMANALAEKLDGSLSTGEFGADMQVSLLNDGPVTIIIDSKNKR